MGNSQANGNSDVDSDNGTVARYAEMRRHLRLEDFLATHEDEQPTNTSRTAAKKAKHSRSAETDTMSRTTRAIIELTAVESGAAVLGNRPPNLTRYAMRRQINGNRRRMAEATALNNSTLLPNWESGVIVDRGNPHHDSSFGYYQSHNGRSKIFCVKYMNEGNTIMTASQDQLIRLYDNRLSPRQPTSEGQSDLPITPLPSAAPLPNNSGGYVLRRVLKTPEVGWSIIDVAVSGDSSRLVYGTWSNCVYECDLTSRVPTWTDYKLCPEEHRMCVFSLRYSDDDESILCGCKDYSLRVVDRNTGLVVTTVDNAHDDDINAVVFGSQRSTIFFSGGDDGLVKVWDARADSSQGPVGVFAGHVDGVTSLDSRGDDRYIISNSKDQSIKLWDIRSFSTEEAVDFTLNTVSRNTFDYRHGPSRRQMSKYNRHRGASMGDASALTMSGSHRVAHTLIRSYFSPPSPTGQRYVLTGSADGHATLYDILNGGEHTISLRGHHAPVRDVAWHPNKVEIVTAGWDGVCKLWTHDGNLRGSTSEEGSSDEGNEGAEESDSTDDANQNVGGDFVSSERMMELLRRMVDQ